MSTRPRAVGITLCAGVSLDPTVGQMSLTGTFHHLAFDHWPATANFTAFVALQGGTAEGTIKLIVSRLETEEDVYVQQKWFAPPPRLTTQLEFRVRRCVFPAPGRYSVALWLDQSELTCRYLDLYARQL